jgi:hypothetical protein
VFLYRRGRTLEFDEFAIATESYQKHRNGQTRLWGCDVFGPAHDIPCFSADRPESFK